MIDVGKYLSRIGVERDHLEPNDEVLRLLQRKHLMTVPFENLDIHLKRPIVLDVEKFYEKIVERRRGGFCYELNGLFNELLRALGFRTRLISGRVFNGSGHGAEFDHAALIVSTGEDEYLADVGFGAFSVEPLRYSLGAEQQDEAGTFRIASFDDDHLEVAKRTGDGWLSEYIFRDIPHELSEFAGMCQFHQSSPESHFTKGRLCSILTESGRKTLTDNKFIIASGIERTERPVGSDEEFDKILKQEFGIGLES